MGHSEIQLNHSNETRSPRFMLNLAYMDFAVMLTLGNQVLDLLCLVCENRCTVALAI